MPTHNLNEIELNILNIMLMHQEKQAFIFENCSPDFFNSPVNRKIFTTAKELFEQGVEVDNVSIFEKQKDKEIGNKLVEILTGVNANSPLIKRYCQLLFDRYINIMVEDAKTKEDLEHIENIKSNYFFAETRIKHISDDIDNFDKNYHKKMDNMIITGYEEIDNNVGSFMGGDYIALGGSTGAGKTTIALNIARQLCMQDRKVLYCSLEMPLEQLQNRFNCINQNLNALKFRSCGFNAEEYQKYKNGLQELKQWNLFVLTDYALTIEKLKIYALQQIKQGLDFIIIDYLGLISGYGNKSLYEKSTIISRKIKTLATELNLPILVLVQLNRDLKGRQDKRPILSDIRESGAIEQDADFVMFAHRPSVYDEKYSEKELELIIAKNRHGNNNKICSLIFDLETQSIKSRGWNNV